MIWIVLRGWHHPGVITRVLSPVCHRPGFITHLLSPRCRHPGVIAQVLPAVCHYPRSITRVTCYRPTPRRIFRDVPQNRTHELTQNQILSLYVAFHYTVQKPYVYIYIYICT